MDIHGYPWISLNMLLVSMDTHEYQGCLTSFAAGIGVKRFGRTCYFRTCGAGQQAGVMDKRSIPHVSRPQRGRQIVTRSTHWFTNASNAVRSSKHVCLHCVCLRSIVNNRICSPNQIFVTPHPVIKIIWRHTKHERSEVNSNRASKMHIPILVLFVAGVVELRDESVIHSDMRSVKI